MKYSSRGIKNEWNIGDSKPKTVIQQANILRKEIRDKYKLLKKLQVQTSCPCCNADLPIK